MSSDGDELKFARTPSPDDFALSLPENLEFDWRLDLAPEVKKLVAQAVDESLTEGDLLTQISRFVVVTRFGVSEDMLQADLRDGSGNRLAIIRIEDNGWGNAYLIRSS